MPAMTFFKFPNASAFTSRERFVDSMDVSFRWNIHGQDLTLLERTGEFLEWLPVGRECDISEPHSLESESVRRMTPSNRNAGREYLSVPLDAKDDVLVAHVESKEWRIAETVSAGPDWLRPEALGSIAMPGTGVEFEDDADEPLIHRGTCFDTFRSGRSTGLQGVRPGLPRTRLRGGLQSSFTSSSPSTTRTFTVGGTPPVAAGVSRPKDSKATSSSWRVSDAERPRAPVSLRRASATM